MRRWTKDRPLWIYLMAVAALMLVAGLVEFKMGRVPICKCGVIRLWVSEVNSAENSQQIFDWYSFSHIIHGFLFYAGLWLLGRGKLSLAVCLVLAVFVEASWEVLENSPIIIDRYRQTMAQGYYGDSILNSMSDVVCAILGFVLAAYLPVWMTIVLALGMEIGVGYMIRDNLALNIIMLIHPFQAIKRWQMGAG